MERIQAECNLIVLPSVDSTNTYAKTHFHELEDGTVVTAIEQFAGRGRLGRKWSAATPDAALTSSAIFKKVALPFHAGAILGLAGLELIREYLPGTFVFFKWPNDIYVREKKLAGILSEGVLSGGKLSGVVSGIGININQTAEAFGDIDAPATSLKIISGKNFFLKKMRLELAEKIKKYYIIYRSHSETVLELWRAENRLIGEKLVLKCPDGTEKYGVFSAIGDSGEMIIHSPDGDFFVFDCGDVKIDKSLINFNLLENEHNKQDNL